MLVAFGVRNSVGFNVVIASINGCNVAFANDSLLLTTAFVLVGKEG